MRNPLLAAIAIVLISMSSPYRSKAASEAPAHTPILVELFTSEGCSSCPPADSFLQKLDRQPVPGAELIVLSEHVDYWNHEGWKDPYSSSFYTERQNVYGSRLGLKTVYTPQMVVDGATQFVGNDAKLASAAIQKAASNPKIEVRVSAVSLPSPREVSAHVETAQLIPSFRQKKLDVYLAIVLDHAESQVSKGENARRHLEHTAVVRKIAKIGELKQNQSFAQDVRETLDSPVDAHNLRVIAFLQEPHQGTILGATELSLAGGTPAASGN